MSGPSMRTASGRIFPMINPSPSDVCLQDIAHHLGQLCRFTGATKRFYTVAEHCVLVALILREQGHDAETQLLGLLHDAAEAYVGDLSSPLKRAMDEVQSAKWEFDDAMYGSSGTATPAGTSAFRTIEAGVVTAILAAYGLAGHNFGGIIKDADLIAGLTEARDLIDYPEAYQGYGLKDHKPYPHNIEVAMIWAQWVYTHELEVILTPAELYKAVFVDLIMGSLR